MKKNRRKTIGIIILICLLVVVGGLLLFSENKEDKGSESDVSEETKKGQSETIQTDINDIPGFISGKGKKVCGLKLPYRIPDTTLVIEKIGQYSGEFAEDGSDEPVANVLSLVIRNDSETFVEYEDVTFTVNKSKQASFKISGIPANKYVLVMEKNKREFHESDKMTYETQLYSEREDVSLKEDVIRIYTADGELTAENISKTPFKTVYIRYKTRILPDCYLGGITYNCTIEELAGGEEKSAATGHFSDQSSEIVMVETVE